MECQHLKLGKDLDIQIPSLDVTGRDCWRGLEETGPKLHFCPSNCPCSGLQGPGQDESRCHAGHDNCPGEKQNYRKTESKECV